MTNQEQKNLREYCAFLLVEHGIQLSVNDPVLPALYVIHKEMQLNNQKNQSIASVIQEASSKINPEQFIFHSGDAAWKFQQGVTLRWGIIGGLVVLLTWVAAWYWSMRNDIDKARTVIGVAGNMEELLKVAKADKSGNYFLDFTAATGDSIRHFTEYQKLNAKTVRVYLGKEYR